MGKNDSEVPSELVHFLKYVENSTDAVSANGEDEIFAHVHKRVQYIKRDHELEVGYMRLEEMLTQREQMGLSQGISQGMAKSIICFLSELGEVPKDVQMRVENETDAEVLSKWIKLAAKSKDIDEFKTQM